MSQVELRGIGKFFTPEKPVLKDISFTIRDGEFFTLLGPSGCGKTTLLRMIAGLEHPSSGEIRIGGQDVTGVSPKDRNIAFVFQNYALYPHLNVRENIAMGLKLRNVAPAEIETRIQEAARILGLEELLARRPKALSGGQRQRVALARAIVRSPSAYMLDEPLSNLDAVLRDKTRGELKLLFKRVSGTAIYVTHDQVEAMTLSDRILLLKHGVIQQIGTPEEIYNAPANTFVASFIGSPPMNLFGLKEAQSSGLLSDGIGPAGARDLICGIRPENVSILPGAEDGATAAQVILAEPTGAQTILKLKAGEVELRAAAQSSWNARNSQAWIRLAPSHLHFFRAQDQSRCA